MREMDAMYVGNLVEVSAAGESGGESQVSTKQDGCCLEFD